MDGKTRGGSSTPDSRADAARRTPCRRRYATRASATYAIITLGVLEWSEAAGASDQMLGLLAWVVAVIFPLVLLTAWALPSLLERSAAKRNESPPHEPAHASAGLAALGVMLVMFALPLVMTLLVWGAWN